MLNFTLIYANGEEDTKELGVSVHGLRRDGQRPVQAIMHFPEGTYLTDVEARSLDIVVKSLKVGAAGVVYE